MLRKTKSKLTTEDTKEHEGIPKPKVTPDITESAEQNFM